MFNLFKRGLSEFDFEDQEKLSDKFWKAYPKKLKSGKSEFFFSSGNSIEDLNLEHKTIKTDLVYLRMSEIWGQNSHCKRMQVGCLIVKNKSIISDGYNGSPSGFSNECEDCDNQTLPYVLHAEANAITKLAKSTNSSEGSTVYITASPCFECSKLIIQSGIKRVVFRDLYRKTDSIGFLLKAGIEVIRIGETKNIK
jgi:dCMP deaminase